MNEKNEVAVILPSEIQELAKKVSADKQKEVSNVLTQIFTGTADWKAQADLIVVKDINDKMSMQMAEVGRKNAKNAKCAARDVFSMKRSEVQQKKAEFDLEDKLWLKAGQTAEILFNDIEKTFEYKAKFAERYEAEQKELRTQLRIERVKPFAPELNRFEFENMSEEMFVIFLSGIEKSYNDRIENEKKAEAERLRLIEEDRKERERINQENERLRKENEEKQKQLEIERKRQVEELAKQKAKAEFEAKAPDKEKMNRWIDSLNIAVPELSNLNAMATANLISQKFEAFKVWAKQQIETL
jgi:hypothetical protein